MRILVAEPSAIITWSYEAVLQDNGHVVIGPVRHASEALRLAAASVPVHLALVEIDLADGDWTGWLLAREMRDRWSVPTLFFTTRAVAELPKDKVALGLIEKPVMSTTLVASLEVAQARIEGRPVPARLPLGLVLFD